MKHRCPRCKVVFECHRKDGPKPYGQAPDHPEEREVVKLMLRMRRSGASLRTITEMLEKRKVRLRRGLGRWNPGTVLRILRREGSDLESVRHNRPKAEQKLAQ